MRKIASFVLFSIFVFLLTSCATIFSKSDYPISLNSKPSGAEVEIYDLKTGTLIYKGRTPAQVTLKAKHGFFSPAKYKITFKLPGYQPKTIILKAGLDGWYFGNFLFGGLIGLLIVDPITGAMWKLPENVTVNLSKLDGISMKYGKRELKIVLYESLPKDLRDKLIRIK